MFICQVTGKLSRHGDPRTGEFYHTGDVKTDDSIRSPEKLNKIVVAKRERTYTKWVRNEETTKWEEVFVSKGWEIVREINASQEGLALWNTWSEDERTIFLKHLV
jgi:hypothetical protein